jgi:hypothetical protein
MSFRILRGGLLPDFIILSRVVAGAGSPKLQAPPTADHNVLKFFITRVDKNAAPNRVGFAPTDPGIQRERIKREKGWTVCPSRTSMKTPPEVDKPALGKKFDLRYFTAGR